MAIERRCRVCMAMKYMEDLDDTGRCRNCADAKLATDLGITYGKLIGGRHETEVRTFGTIREPEDDSDTGVNKKCAVCGASLEGLKPRRDRVYCSGACRKKAEKTHYRNTAERPKCIVCGRECPPGRRTYCGPECSPNGQ